MERAEAARSRGRAAPSSASPVDTPPRSASSGDEASLSFSTGSFSRGHSVEGFKIAENKKQSPVTDNLSPWEEWFICKERELRARLQARAMEEINQQLEKRKEKQELERRKKIAEEKHKQWVQKKNEEVPSLRKCLSQERKFRKYTEKCSSIVFTMPKYSVEDKERRERERKLSKEMAEKAVKDLEKIQLQEKAKEKYKEWLKKKRAEDSDKKKKEKEKERQQEAELQEKKEKSERLFKEWLQTARNKPRPILNSYGYASGKCTGYCDGNSYPAPAYCNPVPWKPIHVPPPKEDQNVTVKKNKRPVFSQSYRSSSMVILKPKSNLYIGSLNKKQR